MWFLVLVLLVFIAFFFSLSLAWLLARKTIFMARKFHSRNILKLQMGASPFDRWKHAFLPDFVMALTLYAVCINCAISIYFELLLLLPPSSPPPLSPLLLNWTNESINSECVSSQPNSCSLPHLSLSVSWCPMRCWRLKLQLLVERKRKTIATDTHHNNSSSSHSLRSKGWGDNRWGLDTQVACFIFVYTTFVFIVPLAFLIDNIDEINHHNRNHVLRL